MTLIKGIPKDLTNADIGWLRNRSSFYQYGYRAAAEKLSEGFKNLHTREKDALIFPIVFLYRHHIELTVKDIIIQIRQMLGITGIDISHHRILDLWDEAEKIYTQLIKDIPSDYIFIEISSLSKPRETVKEFKQHDALSFSFRYSTDKAGKTELENLDYISLNNFQSEIEKVINALELMIETICHE